MSTIKYKLSDIVTADTIEKITEFVETIVGCGNDHLVIDCSEYNHLELETIKSLIVKLHNCDSNKTVEFYERYSFNDFLDRR